MSVPESVRLEKAATPVMYSLLTASWTFYHRFGLPVMLAAFLRNDNDPALATAAVLSGGVFNVFGDWFFVFPCNMGLYGASLATALDSVVSFCVMLTHFFKRTNTLRLVRTTSFFRKLSKISVIGFSSFFIDVAMGILTILFNRQIMKYLGSDALAIYKITQKSFRDTTNS